MTGLLGVSIITCAVLYGLLALILAIACVCAGAPVFIAFATCIVVIVLQFLIAPFLTDLTQRWFYKTNFDAKIPSYLEDFIRQTCADQNMNYPKIGFIDDGAPNAFTYGRTKNDARIVITRGLLELLDEEEVKAVVAHEIGHAVHYDMMLMTMVQLVPMVMYFVYTVCMSATKGGGSDKGKDALAIVGLIALVLYAICQYIILWLSRTREYFADEFSAQVTKNPSALASALVNIGFGLSTREKAKDAKGSVSTTSAIGIFDSKNARSLTVACYENGKINTDHIKNAMKWELWNVWAFWYELGSTHPLISKRIIALSNQAESMGLEPLVKFDYEKPESYVDDFARELFICIMPTLSFVVCAVISLVMVGAATGSSVPPMATVLLGAAFLASAILSIVKYKYTHPSKSYTEANVNGLLGEVKVSMIKSIPAELKGTIIGRGNPGCIFNEDFVLQDESGIMFLDYNQPLWIINKVFALFKSPQYFNKTVTVKGWYRRNMVPFFELYSMTIDGQVKKCYSYGFGWGWRIVYLAFSAAIMFFAVTAM